MSSYTDMHNYVAWIESRWGQAKSWSNWKEIQEEFIHYTPGAVMEALHLLFRSGLKYPPGPSEVLKAVQPVQTRRIEAGVDEVDRSCFGAHVWADPAPYDAESVQSCVLCSEERPAPVCLHPHRNSRGVCAYCLDGGVV